MKKKKIFSYKLIIHLIFILLCLEFIIPFLYMVSLSFTPESVIKHQSYKLIPSRFSLEAYQSVFRNPTQLIDSYKVTILFSVLGTLLSMIVMMMVSYALSREQFKARRQLTFFIYFTMLFSGGLVPSYIINTKILGLGNSFWVYILPSLCTAYYILILRTFFKTIPGSLIEAAKIDGAGEFTIFRIVVIPLSKTVIATVSLLILLGKWNDWYTTLIYITENKLYSLQYLLQKILRENEFLQEMSKSEQLVNVSAAEKPVEGMRFAMAIVAAGPMLFIFPFFQKYFTQGLTIGAVKE